MAGRAPSKGRWTRREAVAMLAVTAICLSLAWLVHAELDAPLIALAELPATPGTAPSGTSLTPTDGFALRPLQAYAEVIARPVFSSTRRPPPPQAIAQIAASSDDLVLAGIVATASDRTALVQHGQPPKIVRLREGETVDGWTVRSIRADRVIVETPTNTRELKLREKSRPGAVAR